LAHRAPTLEAALQESKGAWIAGLGYQTVRGGADLPLLREIPHVAPQCIRQFVVALGPSISETSFHRVRRPELYNGPRVVLARSIGTDQLIRAAYLAKPASFSESVMAIRVSDGDRQSAEAICAFLNSRLARYYLLMTASSWGIERPELKAQDVRSLPMPFLKDDRAVKRLSSLARSAAGSHQADAVEEIEELLASVYRLSPDDKALIDDRLDIQLASFGDPLHPAAYAPPSSMHLRQYGRTLERALNAALGVQADVSVERANGDVVAAIGLDGAPPHTRDVGPPRIDVVGAAGGTIIVRRPTRVYAERTVTLIKLAERKQVSKAAALHDADEITDELLRAAVRGRRH
jgi:hypothetical protein